MKLVGKNTACCNAIVATIYAGCDMRLIIVCNQPKTTVSAITAPTLYYKNIVQSDTELHINITTD